MFCPLLRPKYDSNRMFQLLDANGTNMVSSPLSKVIRIYKVASL
jgi:hypothetical protein